MFFSSNCRTDQGRSNIRLTSSDRFSSGNSYLACSSMTFKSSRESSIRRICPLLSRKRQISRGICVVALLGLSLLSKANLNAEEKILELRVTNGTPSPDVRLFSKHELFQHAREISSSQGFVYLMFYNLGYLELVKSWLCNMRIVDGSVIRSTIFIASSKTAALQLQNFEPVARVYIHDYPVPEAAISYGTYKYFNITLERLLIQNELIQSGINVFIIEADAVWFSSISTYMRTLLEGEIVSADDRGIGTPLISAGFLFFNSRGARFFQEYVDTYASNLEAFKDFEGRFDHIDPGEQHLMTRLIAQTHINVTWLDACHFARGEWYSDSNFRLSCPYPKVLQNNYIVGKEEKVRRAKEWGHWFLSDVGRCIPHLPVPNPFKEQNASKV